MSILKGKRLESQRETLLGRKAERDPGRGAGWSQRCRLDPEERMEGWRLGENPDNCLGKKRGVGRLLVGSWQFEFPTMPHIQQNIGWPPTHVN